MTTALRLRWFGFLTASLIVHALALAWVEVSAPSRGRLPSTLSVLLESPGQKAAVAEAAVKPQPVPPSANRSRDRSGRSRPSSSTPRFAVAPPAPVKQPVEASARAEPVAAVKADPAPSKNTAGPPPVSTAAKPAPSRVLESTPPADDPPQDAAVALPHRFPDNGGVPAEASKQNVSAPVRSAGVPRPRAASTPQTSATESSRHVELLALLHSAISREKRYPSLARRQRREGTATVSFSLSPSGDMDGIDIDRSSGFRMLDTAALGAVNRVAPFTPAQIFLTEITRFKVDVIFKLN